MQSSPLNRDVDFRTCAMCSHNKVCYPLMENAAMISQKYNVEQHTKENPTIPWHWTDLAKICNFFEYKSGSKTEELMRK
jgi:hypothetical protein